MNARCLRALPCSGRVSCPWSSAAVRLREASANFPALYCSTPCARLSRAFSRNWLSLICGTRGAAGSALCCGAQAVIAAAPSAARIAAARALLEDMADRDFFACFYPHLLLQRRERGGAPLDAVRARRELEVLERPTEAARAPVHEYLAPGQHREAHSAGRRRLGLGGRGIGGARGGSAPAPRVFPPIPRPGPRRGRPRGAGGPGGGPCRRPRVREGRARR